MDSHAPGLDEVAWRASQASVVAEVSQSTEALNDRGETVQLIVLLTSAAVTDHPRLDWLRVQMGMGLFLDHSETQTAADPVPERLSGLVEGWIPGQTLLVSSLQADLFVLRPVWTNMLALASESGCRHTTPALSNLFDFRLDCKIPMLLATSLPLAPSTFEFLDLLHPQYLEEETRSGLALVALAKAFVKVLTASGQWKMAVYETLEQSWARSPPAAERLMHPLAL